MERDIQQKMGLVKLLWHWGYTPDIDVKLFHSEGTSKAKVELTDVDVLGFKLDSELRAQYVAGDCKTLKRVSAINRCFWMSGLMKNLGINRGFVILSRGLETDHKMAAQQQGITLLNDDEFNVLSNALLPPDFPHQLSIFKSDTWLKFFSEAQQVTTISKVWDYRRNKYWQDSPQNGLRYTLMEVRGQRRAFEQKNRIVNNVFVDSMTAFAMSLSLMLKEIFQVYLLSSTKEELDFRMKAYVYGGRNNYEHLNSLTQRLMLLRHQLVSGGQGQESAPVAKDALALPEWDHFMQLFRTAMDAPVQFFGVPMLLRYVLFERMMNGSNAAGALEAVPTLTNHTVKLSLDLLKYFAAATQVPEHVWQPVRDILDDVLLSVPSAVTKQLNIPGVSDQEEERRATGVVQAELPLD